MNDFFTGRSAEMVHDFEIQGEESSISAATLDMALAHFKNLEGAVMDYYGADTGDNTFKVDDIVFKVLEDPDDGYRSYLGAIDYTGKHSSLFFNQPIAQVRIETYIGRNQEYSQGDEGYQLVDITDGHVWLEFGTDNTDDYYPMFTFRHMSKEPK